MSNQFHLEQDNISIEIDPSVFDKPDSQLTEQLYEMARRIAESDRNNQIYRQAKKSKSFELQTLKRNKNQLQGELHKLQSQISIKKSVENQNNFAKNNRVKFQQINTMCEDLSSKQKEMQKNNCQILKENEKLEKKLAVLQVQFQIMLKQNKHKSAVAAKLAKQKQQKLEIIKQNQQKMIELQNQCEMSKKKAEDLENQLKQELKNEQQLQQLIRQREQELETQRKKRQQTSRKHQQSKRALVKMVNSAKTLQSEIEHKLKEGKKLQSLHDSLKQKIISMQSQQKKLQQVLSNRRSLINNIKMISNRVSKEEEGLNKIKGSRQHQLE